METKYKIDICRHFSFADAIKYSEKTTEKQYWINSRTKIANDSVLNTCKFAFYFDSEGSIQSTDSYLKVIDYEIIVNGYWYRAYEEKVGFPKSSNEPEEEKSVESKLGRVINFKSEIIIDGMNITESLRDICREEIEKENKKKYICEIAKKQDKEIKDDMELRKKNNEYLRKPMPHEIYTTENFNKGLSKEWFISQCNELKKELVRQIEVNSRYKKDGYKFYKKDRNKRDFLSNEKIYIDEKGKLLFKGEKAPKNHGMLGDVISEWKQATQKEINEFFHGTKNKVKVEVFNNNAYEGYIKNGFSFFKNNIGHDAGTYYKTSHENHERIYIKESEYLEGLK